MEFPLSLKACNEVQALVDAESGAAHSQVYAFFVGVGQERVSNH